MINGANKQAILIVTNRLSKDVIKRYRKIRKAAGALDDVFLLYHGEDISAPVGYEGIEIEIFTDKILDNLRYKRLRKTLVPGSNHFPVLNFFINHPDYTHYWSIEDDVAFSGNWSNLFENVSANLDYDFITSHIRRYSDVPRWPWWKTLNFLEGKPNRDEMINSFNPIYRISNKALKYIDICLKDGYSGHHEVLLPTLLKKAGFTIADFGSADNHLTPGLSYCTLSTMRWKPVFLVPCYKKNQLYHPAKSEVTLRQILVYLKRTVYRQKKYLWK